MSDVKKNTKKKEKKSDAGQNAVATQNDESPSSILRVEEKDVEATIDAPKVIPEKIENDPSRKRCVLFP
jgi:hypothetical protein